MSTATDKLVLYTNRICPFAHRAHIAINELELPFEEVTIDIFKPRDPWYLEINPRGLVPTLKINDEIVPESAIVAQLLADTYPSKLVPASNAPGGALKRARINFFADAFSTKFFSHLFKAFKSDEERAEGEKATIAGAVKEIEPLLADAAPYFGGSDKLTLAEVLTGPFVQRLLVSIKAGGIYSDSFAASLQEQAPKFWKWAQAVSAHPSVVGVLDEEKFLDLTRKKIKDARA